MLKHRISARHGRVAEAGRLHIPLIKHCITIALRYEGVSLPCEVSVLVTDDKGIRKINHKFRGIDKPTDVLSFPMQEFVPAGWPADAPEHNEAEPRFVALGDIVLSAQHVKRQARKYGHTLEQETVYLTVHSVLHLLGYDHLDESLGKMRMREREKKIMLDMGF